MQFESKCSPFGFSGGTAAPASINFSLMRAISNCFSVVSFDARKRRELKMGTVALVHGVWRQLKEHSPLLVHLRTRCDAIDGHVEHLSRPHNVEQAIDALENRHHHLVFIFRRWLVLGMRARMNNAIHVQVKIVELNTVGVRQRRIFWIPLAIGAFGLSMKIRKVSHDLSAVFTSNSPLYTEVELPSHAKPLNRKNGKRFHRIQCSMRLCLRSHRTQERSNRGLFVHLQRHRVPIPYSQHTRRSHSDTFD